MEPLEICLRVVSPAIKLNILHFINSQKCVSREEIFRFFTDERLLVIQCLWELCNDRLVGIRENSEFQLTIEGERLYLIFEHLANWQQGYLMDEQ